MNYHQHQIDLELVLYSFGPNPEDCDVFDIVIPEEFLEDMNAVLRAISYRNRVFELLYENRELTEYLHYDLWQQEEKEQVYRLKVCVSFSQEESFSEDMDYQYQYTVLEKDLNKDLYFDLEERTIIYCEDDENIEPSFDYPYSFFS